VAEIVDITLALCIEAIKRHSVAATRRADDHSLIYGEASAVEFKNHCELSYWVRPEIRRHGAATKLVETLCRHIFKKTSVDQIVAFVSPASPFAGASVRVLERNRFRENQNLAQWNDMMLAEGYQCFSLLKDQWRAKNEPHKSSLVNYFILAAMSVPPKIANRE
jgi:RimJ/RimL family protein N-acetyltransferase